MVPPTGAPRRLAMQASGAMPVQVSQRRGAGMTRKDYVRLAAALKAARPEHVPGGDWSAEQIATGVWARTVDSVMGALADDNPRFDRQRFMAACGMAD